MTQLFYNSTSYKRKDKKMSAAVSALQKARAAYTPKLPKALRNGAAAQAVTGAPTTAAGDVEKIKALFTENFGSPMVTFEGTGAAAATKFNAGVILSGGQKLSAVIIRRLLVSPMAHAHRKKLAKSNC